MILEPAEVGRGVVESVGVVDAQAVDLALGHQPKHQGVRGLEDIFALHRQRGQVVDVEEPAVVDLVRANPPVRKAIALVLEQVVHELEAARVARAAVEEGHVPVDEIADRLALGGERGQPALDHFFLALAFRDFFGLGLRAARKVSHGRQDALKLDQTRIVGTQVAFELCRADGPGSGQ